MAHKLDPYKGIIDARLETFPLLSAKLLPAPTDVEPPPSGRIEIALPDGSRVTVDRDVDAAALSRVLGVLEQR